MLAVGFRLLTFFSQFPSKKGINYREQSGNLMLFTIAVAVEMIYFICSLNLVLLHCFKINLLESFVSGSKNKSALDGKVTPGAGCTT